MSLSKKGTAAGILLAAAVSGHAQNETDALRYSQIQFGGTARIQGMAGAQTALGADMSTLNGNPAGIGMYRRSEATFSPGITSSNTTTRFNGTETPESKGNFNIGNFGVVFTNYKGDGYTGNWKSTSFGLSYTRINHLHARYTAEGTNASNSMVDFLTERSQGYTRADLDAEYGTNGDNITSLPGLAYTSYLLNPYLIVDGSDTTEAVLPVPHNGPYHQREEVLGKGAQNQWDLTFGGNYRDKLFLGASVGFTTVSYRQERTFTETERDTATSYQGLTLTDAFKTSGGGVNLRIGLIYKPTDIVRIGASIQTPTYHSLSDDYVTRITSRFSDNLDTPGLTTNTAEAETLPGRFEYNLTTPFRAAGGLALFAGKAGFFTADVEYVNYGQARFNSEYTDGSFQGLNTSISNKYQSAVNVRLGAEGRYDIFRIRAGYAHYGDPFKVNDGMESSRNFYTVGAGIKQERFFIDLAGVFSQQETLYRSYELADKSEPVATVKQNLTSIVLTGGVTF
jgi:hypothetical protein